MVYLGFITKELILFTGVYTIVVLVLNSIWLHPKGLKPCKKWIKEHAEDWLEWWKHLSGLRRTYFVLAVIVSPIFIGTFVVIFPEFIAKRNDPTTTFYNLSLAVFAILSGLGAIFGFYTSIMRTEIQEQGLITDRINKATEGLGKKTEEGMTVVEVRLGALYALERIAQDSIRDHIQIMEILCAYVRHNSPRRDNAKPLREDIQAAISIIGRRGTWPQGKKYLEKEKQYGYRIDLHFCNLYGAQLNKANLSDANLEDTNLMHAQLYDAKLDMANLENTDMSNADLSYANLRGARLEGATMNETGFRGTDLSGAKPNNATIKDAFFGNAIICRAFMQATNLSGGDFRMADMKDVCTERIGAHTGDFSQCLNLTENQLHQMFCGKGVKIPKDWKRPDHWLKNDLTYDEFEKAYAEWDSKQLKIVMGRAVMHVDPNSKTIIHILDHKI